MRKLFLFLFHNLYIYNYKFSFMAKKSMIEREKKRIKLYKKYALQNVLLY
jgi:hypothetical protein